MSVMRKLSSRKGTTLGEMLVSVLILMMLTMAVAGGAGIAAKVYRTEKAYSESRILANSILLAMTEELRYASGLTVGDGGLSVSYDSRVYGAGTTMKLEQETEGKGGRLKIDYDGERINSSGRTADLYQESTYSGYWIQAREKQPVFSRDGSSVVISYDICDSSGNVKASLEEVKIRLLNGDNDVKE